MSSTLDWEGVRAEAVRHLVNLIRIDTSNPPGNELPAAEYVRDQLLHEGISSAVLEMKPGRANLVARLPGDGSRGPLLFLSHLDVVPAEAASWQHDPFSGDLADGFIWGRGAVDMKHIVASMLTAMTTARRLGLHLRRDLIFAATADEETAGESGAGWLFRSHPELVACELAISEGGDVVDFNGRTYFLIEAAEKGWLTIDLTRRSRPSHSSIPVRENCLYEIGAILERLGARRFGHRVTPVAGALITQLAAHEEEPERSQLLALLDPETFADALSALDCDATTKGRFEALLHSHATPTIVQGGENTWAVPERATVRLAGRVLPGQSRDEWLAELETVIGPLGECELSQFDPGVETTVESAFFRDLAEIVERHNPGAVVLPNLLLGGGDLRHALMAGAHAYGYFPIRPESGVETIWELAHGRDERISLENLMRCVYYALDVVRTQSDISLQ